MKFVPIKIQGMSVQLSLYSTDELEGISTNVPGPIEFPSNFYIMVVLALDL